MAMCNSLRSIKIVVQADCLPADLEKLSQRKKELQRAVSAVFYEIDSIGLIEIEFQAVVDQNPLPDSEYDR